MNLLKKNNTDELRNKYLTLIKDVKKIQKEYKRELQQIQTLKKEYYHAIQQHTDK